MTISEPRRTQAVKAIAPSFFKFVKANGFALTCVYSSFALNFMVGYATALWSPTVLSRAYGVSPGQAGVRFGLILMVTNIAGGLPFSSRPGRLAADRGNDRPHHNRRRGGKTFRQRSQD